PQHRHHLTDPPTPNSERPLKVTQDGMNKNEYMIIGWNTNLGGDAAHPNVTYRSSDGTLSTN
ncbi:MAG: hypothetical protein ACI38B_07440, partial [Bifidobacterium sp.]